MAATEHLMVRTFLDAGVLLTAARAVSQDRERAHELFAEPGRLFLTSPFIHLEVVPKAYYFKNKLELSFYNRFFHNATWYRDVEKIEVKAQAEAGKKGLGAMDALHVAAAHLSHADEFITTEKLNRAIHRSSLVKIVYLFG